MNANEMKGKEKWHQFASNKSEISSYDKLWDLSEDYKNSYIPDMDAGLKAMNAKLASENSHQAKVISMSPMRKMMRIAAVSAVVIVAGFLFNNLLTNSSGLAVLESGDNKIEGFELADGSKIWLNENSELSYPETFEKNERRVILKGEAYFEIQKNSNAPFIVETMNAEIKVLGTSFNVRCMDGEGFDEVQVRTGEVNFSAKETDQTQNLLANDKAVLRVKGAKSELTKSSDENLNALAWKTKKLEFRNTPLKDVIENLERFYHINCDFDKDNMSNCNFSGTYIDVPVAEFFKTFKLLYGVEIIENEPTNFQLIGGNCAG